MSSCNLTTLNKTTESLLTLRADLQFRISAQKRGVEIPTEIDHFLRIIPNKSDVFSEAAYTAPSHSKYQDFTESTVAGRILCADLISHI